MRFEHSDSRYSRYARVSRPQSKRLLIYVVLLVAVVVGMVVLGRKSRQTPQQIEWLPTYDEAIARAAVTGKPIMAFFYVEGSEDCRGMERETFADKTVRAEARHFVCVRIDAHAHPELAKRCLVVGCPAVAFISPEGRLVQVGFNFNKRKPKELVADMRDALLRWRSGTLAQSPSLPPRNAEPDRGGVD